MKLLSYQEDGQEFWGFLIHHPVFQEDWVFNPQQLVKSMKRCELPTMGRWLSRESFRQGWPADLAGFLALEEEGMADLKHLEQVLLVSLKSGSDHRVLNLSGRPLAGMKLKAPIPRPRIFFGLVQNGPSFIRNNPNRTCTNLFPQGHNRPQASVLGPDDILVLPENILSWGFNIELGVVIGKKGRYIPAHRALDYVAGFVPVIDAASDGFYNIVNGKYDTWRLPEGTDWFLEAMCSWCGKMADTHSSMGPYLVTKDEFDNFYDLLAWNRESGHLRNRTYTGCHLLGVERVIQWYSSFGTVYPGDVLHLGTMGTDGLPCMDMEYGPDDYIQVEIEGMGKLTDRVVNVNTNDWRDENDPSKALHPSPAIRDLIESNQIEIKNTADWSLDQVRQYWTSYGNYKQVEEVESIKVSRYPRLLNAPPSSLAATGAEVEIPPRTTSLDIGVELAFVVKKLARKVTVEDATSYILGLTPLISLSDRSFDEILIQPATSQEQALPVVYGRWADDFNIVLPDLVEMPLDKIAKLEMTLEIPGIGRVAGSVGDYVVMPAEMLSFLSTYVTCMPGDMFTLGRIAQRITLPAHIAANQGLTITARIDKMPEVTMTFKPDPSRKPAKISRTSEVLYED